MNRYDPIYKLVPAPLWADAEKNQGFNGAPVDLQDGYIHFSTAAQLRETAAKHFSGVSDLLLVAVDPRMLGEKLQWEVSRGGQLFPHLYAPLPMEAVILVTDLPLADDGTHLFPETIR